MSPKARELLLSLHGLGQYHGFGQLCWEQFRDAESPKQIPLWATASFIFTKILLSTLKRNQKSLLLGSFNLCRTSLVVQWLRICLPMQGTQVPSLVQEDPTCHVATKPVNHNYWTWVPRACALHTMRSPRTTVKSSSCLLQLEKACVQQWRPNATINKFYKKNLCKEKWGLPSLAHDGNLGVRSEHRRVT